MISSKVTRANHPSRVRVLTSTPEGRQSGLLMDSVVMTDNLATVAVAVIIRSVGTLLMASVDNALRHTLDL